MLQRENIHTPLRTNTSSTKATTEKRINKTPMNRHTKLISAAAVSCLLSFSAAAELPGFATQLNKQGEGEYSWFGISLYKAGLWTGTMVTSEMQTDGMNVDEVPVALLSLEYTRNIPGSRIIDVTAKEWRRLGVGDDRQQELWLNKLAAVLPDVSKGDRLSSLVAENGTVSFYLDKELIGRVDEPGFGNAFLAIWLHPETRADELRDELLGDSATQEELFTTASQDDAEQGANNARMVAR